MNSSVAAVILTWNKCDDLLRLLDDIGTLAVGPSQVYVVDNGSRDGTVSAVRSHHPSVSLLLNEDNKGGSGGFNTGLRAVLAAGVYDYVWLLDNDVRLEPQALAALLAVCTADADVGIAGSLIRDRMRPHLVVEAGAQLVRGRIRAEPYYRSADIARVPSVPIDCGYVAICSALVRTAALAGVGLLDERMFLNWDDMEWGMRFRRRGWRVVAVPGSVATHASYTERERGLTTDVYYAPRNALLTYAKHPRVLGWHSACYAYLRQHLRRQCARWLMGERESTRLFAAALTDFVRNRWGACRHPSSVARARAATTPGCEAPVAAPAGPVLIVAANNEQAIMEALAVFRGDQSPWLLVPADRAPRYRAAFGDRIIALDSRRISDSLVYRLRVLVRLLKRRYATVLCFEPTMFALAGARAWRVDPGAGRWCPAELDRRRLPRLAAAAIMGELLALLLLPLMLVAGRRYAASSQARPMLMNADD